MKKKILIVFALVFALMLSLVAFAACSKDGKYNEVSDGDDYIYDNSEFEPDLVEPDEGIVLDGVLDEEMYQSPRWLHAVKVDKNEIDPAYDYDAAVEAIEKAAQMDMVVSFGEKGFYIGFEVQEAPGNGVWVNPDRASYLNSCIELYMAAEGTTGLYEDNTFEIDMMPNGDMVFKKADGVNRDDGSKGWAEIAAPYDTMPRLATSIKGGDLNTWECTGYTLELFVPYNFLEKYGYDTDGLKAGTSELYLNPVNITSYNYDGDDLNADRWWYSTASQLDGDGWTNPSEWYHFNHSGLAGYDINITQKGDTAGGKVMEYLGYDFAVADNTVTFLINEAEGYALKTFNVNGQSALGSVVYDENGRAEYITLGKVTGNIDIEVEFVPYHEGTAAQVSVKDGYTHGTVSLDKDSYIVGDTVTLTLTPEEGYIVRDVLANGESIIGIGLNTEDGGKTFTITTKCVETPLEFEVVFAEATNVSGYQFEFATSNKVDGMSVRLRNQTGEIYESIVEGSTATFDNIPSGLYTFEANITNYWLEIGEYFVSTAAVNNVNISGSFPNGVYYQGDFTDLPAQAVNTYFRAVTTDISEEAWFAMKIAIDPDGAPRGQKYRIGYRMYVSYYDTATGETKNVECGPTLMWYTKYDSFRFSQCGLNWTECDIPAIYNDAAWQRNGEDGLYMIVNYLPETGTMRIYLALSDKSEIYHLIDLQDSRLQGTITQFGVGVWVEGNSYCPAEIHDVRYGVSLSDCLAFDEEDVITISNPAVEGGEIVLDKESYVRGETVTLQIHAEENYVLSALTVNGKDVFEQVSNNQLKFYLIDAELNIQAVFEYRAPVSVDTIVKAWRAGNETDLAGATISLISSQITYEGIAITDGKINAQIMEGTYSAILSLDGYQPVTVVVTSSGAEEIVFEYDLFTVTQGAASNWDLSEQNRGSFALKANAYSAITMNDSVNDFVFEINFTGRKADGANVVRNEVRLVFDNGTAIGFDLLQNGADGKYVIQTGGFASNFLYSWKEWYTLTAEEIEKYESAEGILFKVVRRGDQAYIYLDNILRTTITLTDCVDASATLGIYHWDGGLDVNYNYKFISGDTSASVTVKDGYANGEVTLDKTSYVVTDTVKVTLTPDSGYILKSITVNRIDLTDQVEENVLTIICTDVSVEIAVEFEMMEPVSVTANVSAWRAGSKADLSSATVTLSNSVMNYENIPIVNGQITAQVVPGTYTAALSLDGYFTTTVTVEKDQVVNEIVFEYNLFTVTVGDAAKWDLSEQNRGEIVFNNGGYGAITMTDLVNDFVIEINFTGVKQSANVVRNEIRLAFENGVIIGLDLVDNSIQTLGGEGFLYPWQTHYNLTEEEKAKYNSEEGIQFKVVRRSGLVCLYLDGNLRVTLELTGCEDQSAALSIYHWDGDITVNYKYTFAAQEVAAEVSVKDGYTNGTVTLDKQQYAIGDFVTLFMTPEEGYVVSDVKVNGASVSDALMTEDGKVYYINYLCSVSPIEFEVTFVEQTDIDVQVNFAEADNVNGMQVRLVDYSGQIYSETVENNAVTFSQIPAGLYKLEANIVNYWLTLEDINVKDAMGALTPDLTSLFVDGNVFYEGNFNNLPTRPADTGAADYMEHYNAVNVNIDGDAWFAMKVQLAPLFNLASTNYAVGYRFLIDGEEYNVMLVWKNGDHCFSVKLARDANENYEADGVKLPTKYDRLINADNEDGYIVPSEELTGMYLIVNYEKAAGVYHVYIAMSDKSQVYHIRDIQVKSGNITQFGTALWMRKKVEGTTTISDLRYGATLKEALGFTELDTVAVTNPAVENGEIKLDKESYLRGDPLTLTIQPAEGYVLSSLTVNGEDIFGQVSYNQWQVEYYTSDKLEISATFEAKESVTVSASVSAMKAGEQIDLTGATVSLVSSGITYEDIAITEGMITADILYGTYEAILSLPNYVPIEVVIGTEGLASIAFEYDLFAVTQGAASNWDLSGQNRGEIIFNNGGYGAVTMNDPVNDFVFEVNFTGQKADGANVVRNEVRLEFNNGKAIGFDLLQNGAGGKYIIQTSGFEGNFLYSWNEWYTLTAEEIEKYESAEGILFKVVRQGDQAYIYLDNVLRATITLTDCGAASAKFGLYHWDGGLTVDYKFSFSTDTEDIQAALTAI